MNHSSSSKEEIISVCKDIIVKKGVSCINIRTIASECNISVGTIYNYFPSKSDLIYSAIENIWNDIFRFDEQSYKNSSFIDIVVWLHNSISDANTKYHGFLSLHSSIIFSNNIHNGKENMNNYISFIKKYMLDTLNKDSSIGENRFSDILTKHIFIDYVFELVLINSTSLNHNIDSLVEIVKRCTY